MKAVLALIAIYVAAFIIATQGASQNPVQASTPLTEMSVTTKSIDPVKAADLHSLLEFVGAKEQLQAAANESATQYREKLHASVPNTSTDSLSEAQRQALIAAAATSFQKNFNQQRAMQQIADIYDKHYSEDEVRGLLDFFSSPLGQKFAAESPKIAREVSAIQGAAVASATRQSLQALQEQEAVSDKSDVLNSDGKAQKEITLQDQMKPVSQRP